MAMAVVALVALAVPPRYARADTDFSGKTIEWIIPFSPGGGSDTWARFNAPFFSRYLPGNPVVVVKNEPGGGSTKGTNLFAVRAKPDGLTVLGTSGSTQFPYLLGDPRVHYDYRDWEIVMASPTGGVVYTNPEIGSIEGLKGRELVYASQGATSLDLVPLLAFRLLDMPVKHVFGFKGRGSGRVAFERGETNIDYQTSSAYLKNVVPLVDNGEAVPLFSWGALDDRGDIVRDPTFPDLPSFKEVYVRFMGREPSGELWDAYKAFFVAGFPAQKMMFLPKGTPEDIVAAYRDAVRRMKQDPEYRAKKETVLGTYEQVTDAAADALLDAAIGVSAKAKRAVIDILASEYGVNLGAD